MVDSAAPQYVKHIELYVTSSTSPSQQAASVDAVAALLKNDLLTLDALVIEMDLYLTTTDSIIRSRGILLLGELLTQLTLKPLSDAAIRTLIGFFTDRLADWKALRGALVGCLALMRRKKDVGVVSDNEAKAVAESFMQNVQVQSLGQHDRKLCFELLDCLLDRYSAALWALDHQAIFYCLCESIDEEKDPQCLMQAFHIMEIAAQVFPDPSGPLADYAADLCEILGRYFPIHFTHPKGEEVNINKDELSRALLLAFASTPLFEPFTIPLLLDKLSSSLPSTKVESLEYLSYCGPKYGSARMAKHAEALWSSLKDLLFASPQCALSPESESTGFMVFEESDIMTRALVLLQELTRQSSDSFLNLILNDQDINVFIGSLTELKDTTDDIPIQRRQRLYAVGRLLSVCAKSSIASCNGVFKKFFPHFMEALGLSIGNSSKFDYPIEGCSLSAKFNFGSLYLCIELLDASRYLVVGLKDPTSVLGIARETWCCMLHDFSRPLTGIFLSCFKAIVAESTQNTFLYPGVRGLQILATFPGNFPAVSVDLYKGILLKLVSVLTSDFNKTYLWELVLKALVEIGLFNDQLRDSEKEASFESIVVEKIATLMSSDNSTMPSILKLHAVFDIGMTGHSNMLRVVQALSNAISVNYTLAYVDGNLESADLMIKLLECYSDKVLPWFEEHGGSEELSLDFAVTILDKIESCMSFGFSVQNSELLSATMTAMKQAVGCCTEERQTLIVHKALRVLSSSTLFGLKDSMSVTSLSKSEGSNHNHNFDRVSGRDEWIISLFASVVIALCPQTHIPDIKMILQLFIMTLLRGHVPSAQALSSLINKLPLRISMADLSREYCLEEALEIIFNSSIWNLCKINDVRKCCVFGDGSEMGLSSLSLSGIDYVPVQVSAIYGLAWIGKGLVMRGHEKVKDITMTFLSFLLQNACTGALQELHNRMEGCDEQKVLSLMKSAADAFHILMSDSEACLNKKYHAVIRPLYKQRFYSTIMPILTSSTMKSGSSISRSMLARSFAHIVSETPLPAILNDAKKLIPLLLDCLSTLAEDVLNRDVIYNVLLVISGILMDNSKQDAVIENAHTIVNQLIVLASYPHMMVVRETAIQCLVAVSELPHTRIYPLRTQVLRATLKALDDSKRAVRQEAVRCRQAWASIASRSLHF